MSTDRLQPLVSIVDDDPTIRAVCRTSLKDTGFDTEAAENGKQGLEFLRENNCEHYQGYFCSPPVKAEDFEVFLRASDCVPTAGGQAKVSVPLVETQTSD